MITYSRMYHHYSSYTFCISQVQVQKFLSKCFIKKKERKKKDHKHTQSSFRENASHKKVTRLAGDLGTLL